MKAFSIHLTSACFSIALLLPTGGHAQQNETVSAAAEAPLFDTSYRASPTVSARLQRQFLADIRWSAGVAARDALAEAFAERAPVEIWQELVADDGLTKNNVTDALTSYWVLNWITANGAYGIKVDNAPVRQQLATAFANDTGFRQLGDQQKQELAEGYILNFLLEHAALNNAVERQDRATLARMAEAANTRFRQSMGVDLRALVPGPTGFQPRRR